MEEYPLAKEVGLPQERERGCTTVRFRDGRGYQLPWVLNDWEVERIERNMPPDHVIGLIGHRLPDIVRWIDMKPTSIPFTIYMPVVGANKISWIRQVKKSTFPT